MSTVHASSWAGKPGIQQSICYVCSAEVFHSLPESHMLEKAILNAPMTTAREEANLIRSLAHHTECP